MSRRRYFEYRQPPEMAGHWERFFDNTSAHGFPVTYVPTGGSNPEDGCSVLLWANKAKARRLAAKLDVFFGRPGRFEAWDPNEEAE